MITKEFYVLQLHDRLSLKALESPAVKIFVPGIYYFIYLKNVYIV